MVENQYVSNGNSSLGESEKHRNGMEVGLIDIFRNIIDIRKTIYKVVGIGMLVGIIVAVLAASFLRSGASDACEDTLMYIILDSQYNE